jgi:hypothetical protein
LNPVRERLSSEVVSTGATASAETPCVRSWIFRNRLRLRAIYGPRPSLREAGADRIPERVPKLPVRVPAVVERQGRHVILRTRD